MAAKYDIIFSILARIERGARVCHVTDPIKRQVGRAVGTVGTATPGKSFDISWHQILLMFKISHFGSGFARSQAIVIGPRSEPTRDGVLHVTVEQEPSLPSQ